MPTLLPATGDDAAAARRDRALELHRVHRGKIEVVSRVPASSAEDLSLAYTPGVAAACEAIARDPEAGFDLTARANLVAIVTDGSAVLGLGNIGPAAALPVMEGKSILFKTFAGVDAVPLCLRAGGADEIVALCRALEPTFGGINLEDIAAPTCFEVEARLRRALAIPVFHDDQHGTAIVVAAAVTSALRAVGKAAAHVKVVVNGAGASGIAVARMLVGLGVRRLVLCDRQGAIYAGRTGDMNPYKAEMAGLTNPERERGGLGDVLRGADVFIGVSAAGVLSEEMVAAMAPDAVVMAMANPDPEIEPAAACRAGARIVCTGRSDYPNQINNVEAFPGVFRGALDVRAREINEPMKLAAAQAIAGLVSDEDLARGLVMPPATDRRVAPAVAAAVARAAIESGAARVAAEPAAVAADTQARAERAARLNARSCEL